MKVSSIVQSRGGLSAVPLLVGAILVTMVTGCTVLKKGTPLPEIAKEEQTRTEMGYQLQVGDQIEIHHLSDADYTTLAVVRPDGKINVPGVSRDIQAKGQTISDLRTQLESDYRSDAKLSNPNFAVILRAMGSAQIFVGGEVQRPGFLLVTGADETIMQALLSAGWLLPTARTSEVIVVRTSMTGKQQIFSVNLDKIISGRDLSQNVVLHQMDAVLVPKSDIGALDSWVTRYIRDALPVPGSASASYSYQGNPNPILTNNAATVK